MTSRAARTTALLAAALACGGCSLLPRPAAPAATPRTAAAALPPASLLPFPPARLQAAARLAGQFTASWDSWSWRQPPAAWLARLQPLAAAPLQAALARAAGDRGVLARRAAARQAAAATVTGLAVRDLTPGSVTVAVTVTQVITSSSGTSRAPAGWAVTLTPAGAGWKVWDIEPASAGNS